MSWSTDCLAPAQLVSWSAGHSQLLFGQLVFWSLVCWSAGLLADIFLRGPPSSSLLIFFVCFSRSLPSKSFSLGVGRGIQIPLPGGREMDSNPSPWPGGGLKSRSLPQGGVFFLLPAPREMDFSPLPVQGEGFFLLPAPREMDFSPLPGQGEGSGRGGRESLCPTQRTPSPVSVWV